MNPWADLADRQAGVLSVRQLTSAGVTRSAMRHRIRSQRWQRRTSTVVTTTTGPLSDLQRRWVAVLHCGPGAMLGGLTALTVAGLRRWDRDDVHVLVANPDSFEPVDGIELFRTRRRLPVVRTGGEPARCPVVPAALLWAAYEPHPRSASGLLAAVVQQRLATPRLLLEGVDALRPLRRAAMFRELLADIDGGSESLGEVDLVRLCRSWGLTAPARQRRRRDREGRLRYTDCEWDLLDGRVLVLEIDGAFHVDVLSYTDDVRRQRGLTTPDRVVVRCTTEELRREPWIVARDLRHLGVPPLPLPSAG